MYLRHTLSNGIRIVHRHSNSPVAHCGLMINAGSRDEREDQQGLAHFIEHVIFKGTSKRKSFQILSHMENVGGEINAFTSKEETCIHASFMPQHYERWFDILADILLNASFPEKELKKEKEIIIDEINSYKDSPADQILDDFDELIFHEHPLGRNILGTAAHLRTFDQPMIREFIREHYVTEEMVICTVGRLDFDSLVMLAEKYFGAAGPSPRIHERKQQGTYLPRSRNEDRHNHQAHCVLGSMGYPLSHPRRTALSLLNNILGGPQLSSRLNMSVREKHGFCYSIESMYQPYSDSGILSIYFGTDPAYVEKSFSLISKEIARLRHKRLGSVQMRRAINQLCGQVHIAHESKLHEMIFLGKQILHFDHAESLHEIASRIENVSTSDLLEAANEVLDPSQISVLTFMPGKT